MARIDCRGEALGGDAVGPGIGLLDGGDAARLFARQYAVGKARCGKFGTHQVQRRIALRLGGQGTQVQAGAVLIGRAGHPRTGIHQSGGDLLLVQADFAKAGSGIQQAVGKARQSRFPGRIKGGAGSEVDLHIEHRQGAGGDKIDARAGRRGPVLDVDAGITGRGAQGA